MRRIAIATTDAHRVAREIRASRIELQQRIPSGATGRAAIKRLLIDGEPVYDEPWF